MAKSIKESNLSKATNKKSKANKKQSTSKNLSLDMPDILEGAQSDNILKLVTFSGKFTNSANNAVSLDVYRPNPDPYNFSKDYSDDLSTPMDDLVSGDAYQVDIDVSTPGTFDLNISGDFVNSPIKDSVTNTYSKHFGYVITIN